MVKNSQIFIEADSENSVFIGLEFCEYTQKMTPTCLSKQHINVFIHPEELTVEFKKTKSDRTIDDFHLMHIVPVHCFNYLLCSISQGIVTDVQLKAVGHQGETLFEESLTLKFHEKATDYEETLSFFKHLNQEIQKQTKKYTASYMSS